MTDYKNIKGKKIKFFTSDLDNAQSEGQIFYSGIPATTSAVGTFNFKAAVASAAWSASAALNTARNGIASFGLQTAAVAATGADTSSSPSENAATEHYNGTSWSEGGALNTARRNAGAAGIQTSAVAFGGSTGSLTGAAETYDGSSWTNQGSLLSTRAGPFCDAGATNTAALCGLGEPPASPYTTGGTEGFDGSVWSTRPTAATARRGLGGAGTDVLAFAIGGYAGGASNATEEFTGDTTTETGSTVDFD